MNLPNKLTVLRLIMTPVFMALLLIPVFTSFNNAMVDIYLNLAGALLFIAAAVTDLLDGKIARKHNLITDFGKFLDPLADKFMVIGAMLCIFAANAFEGPRSLAILALAALVITILRELAVTSIRLVASSSKGVVIAANILGKIKTVTQIVSISAFIIEPILWKFITYIFHFESRFLINFPPITFISTALALYFTIHSGLNYIIGAWKYLDPEK